MSKLPTVSGKQCIKALEKIEFFLRGKKEAILF